MNYFFKDAFEKRNTLVDHLTSIDNYFKSYESSDDLLVVFSNFIFSVVLFFTNFVYFFVELFTEGRFYFDLFKNLLIDIGLIFLSSLISISMLISTIVGGSSNAQCNKELLDETKKGISAAVQLSEQVNEELEQIIFQIQEMNYQLNEYSEKILDLYPSSSENSSFNQSDSTWSISLNQAKEKFYDVANAYPECEDFSKTSAHESIEILKKYIEEKSRHHLIVQDKALRYIVQLEGLKSFFESKLSEFNAMKTCRQIRM